MLRHKIIILLVPLLIVPGFHPGDVSSNISSYAADLIEPDMSAPDEFGMPDTPDCGSLDLRLCISAFTSPRLVPHARTSAESLGDRAPPEI